MRHPAKHIVLKITNQGVFYNEASCVAWQYTNFPAKHAFTFSESTETFWRVEMLGYSKQTLTLEVSVSDYEAGAWKDAFLAQAPKSPIRAIHFQEIVWKKLIKALSHYKPRDFESLANFKIDSDVDRSSDFGHRQAIWKKPESRLPEESGSDAMLHDVTERHEVAFSCSLMKTKFKMGCVEIQKKIKALDETVTIILENNHIIPEFDHVKPYFAKILGKKKIEVSGYIEVEEGGQLKVNCRSANIDRITEETITSVKALYLKKSITHPKPIVLDKSLFSPEEYFGGEEDELLGNITQDQENSILDAILELEGIRNRKQLIYLSGKLHSANTGLKFTLSPKFGFLFFVEGEKMDHFLWELLDSHATYIWSIAKDAMSKEEKFRTLEREINFIRENGRRAYLNNSKASAFFFSKVNHESSKSGIVDGFPKWKMRVNERLI